MSPSLYLTHQAIAPTHHWCHELIDHEKSIGRSPTCDIYLEDETVSLVHAMNVIRGRNAGAHLVNLRKPWHRIRAKAGLDGLRIHDLRHSFASFGAAAGLSLPMIGKMLGHTQAQTTQRYAHLSADPLKRAVDTVTSDIAAAMNGSGTGVVEINGSEV